MADKVHVGDVGTRIELTVTEAGSPLDISSATTKEIILRGPGGIKVTKDAVFVADGTDGKIEYTTEAGDLSKKDIWKVQAHIILASGTEFHTSIAQFKVHANL